MSWSDVSDSSIFGFVKGLAYKRTDVHTRRERSQKEREFLEWYILKEIVEFTWCVCVCVCASVFQLKKEGCIIIMRRDLTKRKGRTRVI